MSSAGLTPLFLRSPHRISATAPLLILAPLRHILLTQIHAIKKLSHWAVFKKKSRPYLFTKKPISCLLSHVSFLTTPVSYLLSHVSCLMSPVSCLLSHVYCLLSRVCCLVPRVSCLTPPVSCLLSHVSCLLSPVSRLLSQQYYKSRCQSPVAFSSDFHANLVLPASEINFIFSGKNDWKPKRRQKNCGIYCITVYTVNLTGQGTGLEKKIWQVN